MQNQMKLHIKFLNSILLIGILTLLLTEFRLITQAQDAAPGDGAAAAQTQGQDSGAEDEDESEANTIGLCRIRLIESAKNEREEFAKFMNLHFQQAKPTSDLIPEAIEELRKTRGKLKKVIDDFGRVDTALTVDILTKEREDCTEQLDEEMLLLKEVFRQHTIQNAYAKKTILLVDKFKQINGRLEELNFNVAEMYANFGSFAQKLPCYTEKCTGG